MSLKEFNLYCFSFNHNTMVYLNVFIAICTVRSDKELQTKILAILYSDYTLFCYVPILGHGWAFRLPVSSVRLGLL